MAQKELKLLLTAKDEASKVLDKVSGSATGMSSKIGSAMKVVAAGAAAAAGAVAVATTALYKITTGAAESADRIDKMSQRLGMSRTAFQQWDFVLSQNGVSIDSLQMGMKSLVQRMDEAIDGTGKGAELFNKLGVSVTDSSGAVRKQEDVFLDTVRALQNMEEGVQKAALSQEMFSRNGQEMLPMLNQSKGSVDELMQKFKELGIELDDNAIDAGVRFTDTMDQVKRSLKTLTAQIGVEVMPIFQSLLDWILAHMPQIRKVMETVFGGLSLVVRAFGKVVEGLMPIFENVFNVLDFTIKTFSTAWNKIWGKAEDDAKEATDGIKDLVGDINSDIATTETVFKGFANNISESFFKIKDSLLGFRFEIKETDNALELFGKNTGNAFMLLADNAVDLGIQMGKVFIDIAKAGWEMAKSIARVFNDIVIESGGALLSGMWTVMKDLWESFSKMWDNIEIVFTDLIKGAVEWGAKMISSFSEGIMSKIMAPVTAVKSVLGKLADYFPHSPAKEGPLKNIIKWGQNTIAGFAQGMRMESQTVQRAAKEILSATEALFTNSSKDILAIRQKQVDETNRLMEQIFEARKSMAQKTVALEKSLYEQLANINKTGTEKAAQYVVDTEKKLADLKEEISDLNKEKRDAEDAEEKKSIQATISEKEKEAKELKSILEEAKNYEIDITGSIAEIKRRAGMTELQRIAEDIKKETDLATEKYHQEKALVEKQTNETIAGYNIVFENKIKLLNDELEAEGAQKKQLLQINADFYKKLTEMDTAFSQQVTAQTNAKKAPPKEAKASRDSWVDWLNVGRFQTFATGGVVSSPTLGLIGEGRYNEAVVPLPDGRSIPVEMRGGGITIQVTGNTFLGSARDVAKEIGKALKSEIDTNLRYAF